MNILRKAASVCASAALSTALLLGAAPAHAQSGSATQTFLPIPQSFTDFGKTLADNYGVYLSASYIEELWHNWGGVTNATYFPGELTIGATLDFEKMVGLTGSSLHIIFDERNNWNIATAIGSGLGVGINPVNRKIRLTEFYWEQGFDHDRLDLIFGRTNPTLFFATSALSCAFPGAFICAQPESWYNVNNNVPFPFSEWGGRANFQITKDVYVRAGAYQDNILQVPATQGFSWQWNQSTGVFTPVEVGYETKTSKYDVGFYYDSTNSPLALSPGRIAWWAQGQQVVFARGPQTITVLGGALVNAQGKVPQYGTYYVGAFMTAPFISRPLDTIEFEAAYWPLSRASSIYNAQYGFDLSYGFTITPGVVAKPTIMYIIHPSAAPTPVNNAWVLGAQLYIDLASILKWPVFVPH